MKSLSLICCALVFPILTVGAAAQDVTVTVGEPPFIMNKTVNKFADITITENSMDALADGYFLLYFQENPDQRVTFNAISSASGSIAAPATVTGALGVSALLVQVDAEDDRIDSITVEVYAEIYFYSEFYAFRNSPIGIQLRDDPTIHGLFPAGAGTGLGSATGTYSLGIFGGNGGIEIGESSEITLIKGDTVTLDLDHGHPAHIIVESFDPIVVSVVSHTLTQVELHANAPGYGLVQAWNPLGESGYLGVTVLDAPLYFLTRIRFLIEEIESLVPADLNLPQTAFLTAHLRSAAYALENDRLRPACVKLRVFTSLVEVIIRTRRLDAVIGGELLAEVVTIREGIGCE